MKLLRYCFFFMAYTLSLLPASAQMKDSAFALVYLSNDISTDAGNLKDSIAVQKSLTGVKNLVLKTIKNRKGLIVVTYQRENIRYRWQRRFGEKGEGKSKEWIVLGRRGGDEITISRANEFQKLLKDTVALMDTLSLVLNFAVPAFDTKGFWLRLYNNKDYADEILRHEPPRTLVIHSGIAGNLCKSPRRAELYGKSGKDILLAKFYLVVVCAELKSEWLSIVHSLKEIEPDATITVLADYLQLYINDNYPGLHVMAIKSWLAENM